MASLGHNGLNDPHAPVFAALNTHQMSSGHTLMRIHCPNLIDDRVIDLWKQLPGHRRVRVYVTILFLSNSPLWRLLLADRLWLADAGSTHLVYWVRRWSLHTDAQLTQMKDRYWHPSTSLQWVARLAEILWELFTQQLYLSVVSVRPYSFKYRV